MLYEVITGDARDRTPDLLCHADDFLRDQRLHFSRSRAEYRIFECESPAGRHEFRTDDGPRTRGDGQYRDQLECRCHAQTRGKCFARFYLSRRNADRFRGDRGFPVITSYSIHYTKLYEFRRTKPPNRRSRIFARRFPSVSPLLNRPRQKGNQAGA